jgi:hypothetical protein
VVEQLRKIEHLDDAAASPLSHSDRLALDDRGEEVAELLRDAHSLVLAEATADEAQELDALLTKYVIVDAEQRRCLHDELLLHASADELDELLDEYDLLGAGGTVVLLGEDMQHAVGLRLGEAEAKLLLLGWATQELDEVLLGDVEFLASTGVVNACLEIWHH